MRADLEVTCFQYEGIEAIRRALAKGVACGTKETPVRVRLVAPPLYVALTQAMEKEKCAPGRPRAEPPARPAAPAPSRLRACAPSRATPCAQCCVQRVHSRHAPALSAASAASPP